MDIFLLILQLLYFFLPVALANMAPVLFQNNFKWLAKPVDSGYTVRGEPLFGSHKTWRGLIVATVCGGILFSAQYFLALQFSTFRTFTPFDILALPLWFGFGFAAAAIIGDLVKSFFKRRVRIAPGHTWFPFDQIDFLLGAALFGSLFVHFTLIMWILLLSIGPLLHTVVNRASYVLELKETPW